MLKKWQFNIKIIIINKRKETTISPIATTTRNKMKIIKKVTDIT